MFHVAFGSPHEGATIDTGLGHTQRSAGCGSSIAEFETVINSDAETGNLNKGVHRRITAELASATASCAAGRDADASRALAAIKARHGYR